jgi:hypothetical protein
MNNITIYESLTYSEAQILVSNSELTPNAMYYITDKNVVLTAISSTQFAMQGIYLWGYGVKSWGAIQITGNTGTSGTVDSITVNGINIISSSVSYNSSSINPKNDSRNSNVYYKIDVNYDTSLFSTAKDVVTKINNSQSDYKAYAVRDWIVIQSVASGTGPNGYSVSGSGTDITLGNAINMNGGTADPSESLAYECDYDFPNDVLYRLYDPLYNNEIRQDSNFQNNSDTGGNSILDFNWNQSNVYNNHFYNMIIYPNFLESSSKFNDNEGSGFIKSVHYNNPEYDANGSSIGENLLISGSSISGNKITLGELQQNVVNGDNSRILGNVIIGGGSGMNYRIMET